MKPLPFWLALILGCLGFAGIQFGFHLWVGQSLSKAATDTLITTVIWGAIMFAGKNLLAKRNQN